MLRNMTTRLFILILIWIPYLTGSVNGAEITLVINELMASNSTSIQDPQGHYDDWIEIYNYGVNAINIGGMYLTDNLSVPKKWRIPANVTAATTVAAGGHLLIWADNDTADTGLHANFKLDADGEQISLFDSDGVTLIDSITFPDQTTDMSYGRYPDGSDDWRFFGIPSPETGNSGAYLGLVADTKFSHNRGFYDTPFSVTIATETEGAVIYYTLDGSEPYTVTARGFSSGRVYSGPIPISTTTCLRAKAVKSGWKSTNEDTHTYIFLADVIRRSQQQILSEGYPSTWFDTYSADYGMDPEVYNDSDYANLMDNALLSIPTVSVVTNKDNLFSHDKDPETGGIYVYTGHSITGGQDWERPVSAEFITQDGSEEFQVNCGIRIQGGESRRPDKCPKHSFSLRFRDEYGPTRLNFKLFDEWPVNSFDTVQLRGFFNNAWTHWAPDQRERTQYIRDQWMRDTLIDMGHIDAGQGFFVHLYLNGIYWGLYNLHERPVASHYVAYNGGDGENIDAINGGDATDGSKSAWNRMRNIVASRNWDEIQKVLDVDNFIDWTLLCLSAGNVDLKTDGNWRAAGGGLENRPWHFYSWDGEHVLENVRETGTSPSSDPTGLFNYLDDIEEFRVRFGDRVHKHHFNGGALTPENNIQRWTNRSDELNLAVIAESARWGDYRRDVHRYSSGPYYLYTKNEFWIPERDRLINQYFPARLDIALDYFRSRGLYPRTDAPVFRINGFYKHGGLISKNNLLSMTATTGTILYSLDGSDPRSPGTSQEAATLVPENAEKRVLVPTETISDNWKGGGVFSDQAWSRCTSSPGGVGYERSSGYQQFITLDVQEEMYAKNTTCYIRIPFTLNSNPDDFSSMTLNIRYDDGFVAYLNGVEVARRNFNGTPSWNSNASASHSDSAAVLFESIDITAFLDNLRQGANLLAIHGLNASTTSSDFLISAELTASGGGSGDGILPGVIEYAGPVTLPHSLQVKARVLSGNSWSALNEAVYAVGPVAENLRIIEIMYNPPDPNEEFIELQNIGTETINLNLVSFTNGIDFTFPGTELAAGEYVVVVQDRSVFEARYGTNINIAGQYSGKLNNAGERIELQDAIGRTILDFRYKDGWRSITDGEGFSLTIIDPANPDLSSWDEKDSWRPSAYAGGSQGYDDSGIIPHPGAIVINEVMAHSHAEASDWIELYNTTGTAIDISGWFLSDSNDNLAKYKIAEGTTIGPNGYLVLYEDLNFGNANDPGSYEPFALSENGEKIFLVGAAQNNILTGYRAEEDFGASETGVSFGRYYKPSTGNYNFVAMDENTPGSANSYPKVGPIVISEIMYNPDWPEGGSYTNDQYEYIELHNISAEPVTLYDFETDEPWKVTDGIEFSFPADAPITIPAGGYILVVKTPAAFSLRYPAVPAGIILGPYDGNLSNAGESLELSMPGDIDNEGVRHYIRVDRINYSDGSHPEDNPGSIDLWPVGPDGYGGALKRRVSSDYGNDPDNWTIAAPSPGE
ncbi:MAG TPA: lamin tail domain-containing protein [Sedimentisphaerales bacterium]|nr:lamin tail domain-containing protein [Sedimentisphaerales bacterium]